MRHNGWEMRRLGDVIKTLGTNQFPVGEADRKRGLYPCYVTSGVVGCLNQFIFDDGDLVIIVDDGLLLGEKMIGLSANLYGQTGESEEPVAAVHQNLGGIRYGEGRVATSGSHNT